MTAFWIIYALGFVASFVMTILYSRLKDKEYFGGFDIIWSFIASFGSWVMAVISTVFYVQLKRDEKNGVKS